MIRFHQSFGAHAGRVLEFAQDVVRFGRHPTSDVPFDPHADIDSSGQHAEVRREPDGYYVVDVGSRNGTILNGRRVQRALLANGDEIEFGPGGPRVRVEIVQVPAPGVRPVAATPYAATASATPAGGPDPYAWPQSPVPGAPREQTPPVSWTPPVGHPSAPQPGGLPRPGGPSSPQPMPSPYGPPGGAPGYAAMTPTPGAPAYPSSQGAVPIAGAAATPAPGSRSGSVPVGHRTVGMMIQAALQQSQSQRGGSSTGLIVALVVLALLLVVAVLALAYVLLRGASGPNAIHREASDLEIELAALAPADVARGAAIDARLTQIATSLEPATRATAARIRAANHGAVYLVVEHAPDGHERGLCTAFSVQPDLLATAAHCVVAMEQLRARGSTFAATASGSGGGRADVTQMWRHPGFAAGTGRPCADVALVQIGRAAPTQVRLASGDDLTRLEPASDLFVLGYTGLPAEIGAPEASVNNVVLGRFLSLDGAASDPARGELMLHGGARTNIAAAGSPVFDEAGNVVALHAGSFRPEEEMELARSDSTGFVAPPPGSSRYGVRIDLLLALLAGLGR